MGCLGYILFVLATGWAINNEWIIRNTDMNLWVASLVIIILVGFVEALLYGIRLVVKLFLAPAAFLTAGLAWAVINWVFKYFALFLVCTLTGWFDVPWIFGPLWWQALIIGGVMVLLTGTPSAGASSSSSSSKSE